MKNLIIKLPLVNGGEFPLDYDNGKELIDEMCGDDISPPPRSLVFEVQTKDNKTIIINIPYDQKAKEVFVSMLDKKN